ncbi:gag-pol polyprotein [Tanacetum coccineum]
MKAILRKDKCLAAIGEMPVEITDDSKWDEMDGNAIANLHLALADGFFFKHRGEESCNDHELKIIGIGSIMVMHDGTVRTIRDVRHMKGLKKNLLCLGKLDDLGCKIMEEVEALIASHNPSHKVAVTWHQKLGHMSEQGMKILVERKLLPGLIKVSLPFCEHCVIIKQHRLKFKTSNSRSVFVLELVTLMCVKHRFNPYEEQSTLLNLILERKSKCLRTDNRGEYTCDEFDTFCKKEGIKRPFIIAYTPQHNRVAEWMNITLLERARAMLAIASLGKSFWAKVVNTTYASNWKEAMEEEIEALQKNKTWELVPLPGGRKPIGNK